MSNKTRAEDIRPEELLEAIEPERKREDALRLLTIYREETGIEPKVWTGGMIGFGEYDYTYSSGYSGTAFLTGFAARKQNLTLYLHLPEGDGRETLLKQLGKCRATVACVYINRLSDIDEAVLRDMIRTTLVQMKELYPDFRDERMFELR